MSFESSAIFGNNRSKRYALLVENGKVKEAFVEPDNIGLNGRFSLRRDWRGVTNVREISLRCREGARLKRYIRMSRATAHGKIPRATIDHLLEMNIKTKNRTMNHGS